jgi:hypothetical protein
MYDMNCVTRKDDLHLQLPEPGYEVNLARDRMYVQYVCSFGT